MEVEEFLEEIKNDIDNMDECCKPIVEKIVYLASAQAKEMDRFFKAVGLHGEKLSIDDAINIVLGWKGKNA